jgi:tRNA-binding EMAP/Myf-like protein
MRKIRGIESQGMLLAVVEGEKPILLHPDKEVSPGSIIQ